MNENVLNNLPMSQENLSIEHNKGFITNSFFILRYIISL